MWLSIDRKIFDRVKTAVGEAGRIDMPSLAESRGSVTAESAEPFNYRRWRWRSTAPSCFIKESSSVTRQCSTILLSFMRSI
jgi:hypothetical protein